MDDKNSIFIDVESKKAWLPLSELVEEAYSKQISIFQYGIGTHIPLWRNISVGDTAVYAIDDIGVCGGEISFLRKRAFRPRWFPDNESYKSCVHFARGMCCHVFDDKWEKFMKDQHVAAIDFKRWFFMVFAVIKPTYYLLGNKTILDERVKAEIEAEEEMARAEAEYRFGGMGTD